MKRLISLALCFMLVFTLCPPAFAAGDTMTWTGTGANDYWNTADNWDPAQVPGTGDTAVIPAAKTAAVTANTTVALDCSGEVRVGSGGQLTLAGASYLRNGKLGESGGGTPGKITIANSGALQWSGGSIEGTGILTVGTGAELIVGTDSDVYLGRPLVNDGQLTVSSGELILAGGSRPLFAGGGGSGALTVSGGAYLTLGQGAYSIGGNAVNGGNLSLWQTSSALFKAGYQQEGTGTLSLKVWGNNSYNKLNVTGEAVLGGSLEVDLINDFVPLPGDTFEVMTCGSRVGAFSSIISNMPDITFEPTYTDTSLTLTVAAASVNVCKIGAVEYPTLDDALTAVHDGETIELLEGIDYTNDNSSGSAIRIDGKQITFNLSNHTLSIYNSVHEGVSVVNGAEVLFTGGGELNIHSKNGGLYVFKSDFSSDSSVTVTIVSSNGFGINTNLSTVQISNGSASGYSYGIYALSGNMVTVNGPATVNAAGSNPAVFLDGSGNTVHVGSAVVQTGTGHGVFIRDGGSVTVGSLSSPGRVSGKNDGIYVEEDINNRTFVTVYGDVEGISYGIHAFCNAEMKVYGNVRSTATDSSRYGVSCISDSDRPSSLIEVEGDVAGPSGVEVIGAANSVKVTGDVTANGTDPERRCGVYANGGTVEVGGNVNAADCAGAWAYGSGQITVDGSISAARYVKVMQTEKTIDDRTLPTTKEGYHTYQGGTATVWVKDDGAATTPSAPQNFVATPGNRRVDLSWAAPFTDGGNAITEYQVSGDDGATWTGVGLGTSHTFTGLTNGMAYTFRVRAVNDAGNGETASVTATPLAAPAGPEVSPASLDIATGGTGTFTVSLGESGNEAVAAVVTSTDSSIATVEPADITTSGQAITVNGVSAGNTTITIAFNGGSYTGGNKTVGITVTDPVPVTHAVNFYSNGSLYASKTVTSGSALGVNWPGSPTRGDYSFGGWFTGQGGAGTRYSDSTIITADVDLYAKWMYIGGGSSDDSDDGPSGGSSAPATPTTPTYEALIKAGSGAETTLPVTVDKQAGTATVSADSQNLTEGGTVVTIPTIPDVDTYSAGIPVPELSTTDTQHTLTLNTGAGSIIVPSNMLTGVAAVAGNRAQISIGQGAKENLPDDVKDAIGDRPLVQLTLCIDGEQINWHNPVAPVTVSIPYTPTAAELADPESIVIWYIDGDGNPVSVPNGHFDPETETVTFTTAHFSYYAVSHNHVSFVDVPNDAWYARAVSFVAAREVTTGAEGDSFNPEAKLTRGESLVMLMKAYGIAPDLTPQSNFLDAASTQYAGYLAAAMRLGISGGVGNNLFAPDKEITRQEVFTLLHNTLKAVSQLPHGSSQTTLSSFSDVGEIAPWANAAMTLLVETGTVGVSGDRLAPKDTMTRAQLAQMLCSLLSK